jgi:hypothetical protein
MHIYVPVALRDRLLSYSNVVGISMSAFASRAIDKALEKEELKSGLTRKTR